MVNTSPSIESMFQPHIAKRIGNKRQVWEVPIQSPSTKEKHTYFIKDRQKESELQVLQFLNGKGIAEELYMYDEKKLVFKSQKGEPLDTFKLRFNNKKLPISQPSHSPRFQLEEVSLREAQDNIAENDPVAGKFCTELMGRFLYLVTNGILHNDIKVDNIHVENGSPSFIDFGEAIIVNKGDYSLQWLDNLRKTVSLISDLYTLPHNSDHWSRDVLTS